MLARNSLLILINNVVGGTIGFVVLYAVGHWMGPEPLGRYAYAGAVVGMLGILGDLGIGQAHVKLLSEAGADRPRCIGTFALLQVALGALVALGFLALVAVAERAPFLFGSREAWPGRALLGVLVLALLLTQLRGIATTTLMGLRRTAQQEVILLVEHLVRLPAMLLAAWIYADRFGARGAGTSGAVAAMRGDTARGAIWLGWASLVAVAASAVAAFFLLRWNRLGFRAPTRDQVSAYVRFALPLAVAGAIAVVASNFDRVTIGRFCDEREVGIYYGVVRLLAILAVIPAAAATLLLPRFSELVSHGEAEAASALFSGALRRIWMVVSGALALCIVFAPEGTRLVLGPDFAGAADVLRCLAPQALALGVVTTCTAWLAGGGRSVLVARVSLLGALFNIGLNLVLVPQSVAGLPLAGLGARGAALATSFSSALAALWAWRWARLSGARLDVGGSLVRQCVAGLAAAGALAAWKASPLRLPFESAWALVLGGVVGTVLYLALLRGLGEFGPSDRRFFREVLDSRLLAQAVSTELRDASAPHRLERSALEERS